ncbi:MAG: Zn-dependent exopeptidase M28 [Treponema sp.]|nr:Zn-dependent exopeptidase M28 [Treponema sp.]
MNVDFSVISLEGKNHIYIKFSQKAYDPKYRIKTVLVHYDRFEKSPGANDNSAAVFQVLHWIKNNTIEKHNMRIFFTDGEEMGLPNTLKDKKNDLQERQGSFALAQVFKRLGIVNDDIFVLDGTGRGEVLVVSTAGKASGSLHFQKQFSALYESAISLAKRTSPQGWITAPVPYGDNAGFISQGIPAVALTVLPKEEAKEYLRNLQKDKNFARNVMNHEKAKLPLTWCMMHTEMDNESNLTPSAFLLMKKFLNTLAKSKRIK